MNFFRRLIKSKVGGILGVVFLAVVFFAFAAGDISGSGGLSVLGPPASEVARIGNQSLTTAQLQDRVQRVFERYREQQPEMTMAQFLAQDGLKQVADQMIEVKAMIAYGEKHGMRISKKLVDAEIARNPAFADASGSFSQTVFEQMLAQQRVPERELRDDLTGTLIRQQILGAAGAGSRAPAAFVPPYTAMLLEQRVGEMIAVPSATFAPAGAPDENRLKAYFAANPASFALPEQRKLRYILVDRARFDAQADPTAAELQQAFKSRSAEYAARESRDFTLLNLATQAQAKDVAAKAAAGQSLADLARGIGLSVITLKDQDQAKVTAQVNAEAARAGFTATKGATVGPFRSSLGWALIHVDDVRTIPGKTFEQARAELLPALKEDKAKRLFEDYLKSLDDKLGDSATLTDLAKAENLTIVETPLLTVDGRDVRNPEYKPDAAVTVLLKDGFAMIPQDDPQIVPVVPDQSAAILAPGDVVPAGPPPFAEVRAAVEIAWRLSEGAAKARSVANQVVAALNKGVPVDEALKQAGISQTPRQPLTVNRMEQGQQGVLPPPVKAMFALRAGSARLVPMERSQGFLVVRLDKIVPVDPSTNPSLLQSTRAGISNVLGDEYARGLVAAIEQELKVTRNPAAFASVEAELRKANGAAQ